MYADSVCVELVLEVQYISKYPHSLLSYLGEGEVFACIKLHHFLPCARFTCANYLKFQRPCHCSWIAVLFDQSQTRQLSTPLLGKLISLEAMRSTM